MTKRRRRVKHQMTLKERLEAFADQARHRAAYEQEGEQRDLDLKRVRASEAALSMIDYLASRESR